MLSMRWRVVWLIFRREVRDQLRDRRTLFMIFVLPVLLYPMLGLGMIKLAELQRQKPHTVVLLGAEYLPESPALLNAGRDGFDPALFDLPTEAELYAVRLAEAGSAWADDRQRAELLRQGLADIVVILPRELSADIAGERQPSKPKLAYDSGAQSSRDAARVVRDVLARWDEGIVQARLARDEKTSGYLQAIQPELGDVASARVSGGSPWVLLFPFLLVMMSLTGAFYPAVDLCAGEKERGTMETLLISPATRPEIVTGKFLTVMLASMATALLNLASMGATASLLSRQTAALGARPGGNALLAPPSLDSAVWMVVLLIPLSAFFSALCVALAAMARSMKEGQYYLSPLYMIALPLIFATLVPGIELDLFTSLVPITGASLLLRALMLEKYHEARQYFLPVLLPLTVYGALALRWAVRQFQRESVLFREAEKLDVVGWLRHVVRDRGPLPTGGQALLCFVLMITAAWYSMGWMGASWIHVIVGQIGYVLVPPVALAVLLTSNPRRSLRLRAPSGYDLAVAVALAFALNPIVNELGRLVELMFPMSRSQRELMEQLSASFPDLGTTLVTLAVVPAICEEFAFRGFILSGLEREYRRGSAVVLSALLFGFLHVLLSFSQQLFGATLLGIVLALIAARSRSLFPGIVFHGINNGLGVTIGTLAAREVVPNWMGMLYREPARGLYHGTWIALGGLVSAVLIAALCRDLFGRVETAWDARTADSGRARTNESADESADADAGGAPHLAGEGRADP